ncbi:hypothetical protein JXA85_04670 [Candidatus Woesearchaeota archaeon]|nr:hypothetical protein [Candidatus Woesearchaeota archaeon]
MNKTNTCRKIYSFLANRLFWFMVVSLVLACKATTHSAMLPWNTYIASDWSDVYQKLDGMDSLQDPPIILRGQPSGDVRDSLGNALPNRRIWIVDEGWQIVGVANSYIGIYDFRDDFGIFANHPMTPEDEGAEGGDFLKLVVFDISIGTYNLGYFKTGTLATEGYNLTPGRCNIEVTDITIIPEPSILILMSTGTFFLRRG